MFKKSIIISILLIILSSCTPAKNETPEDVLLKNQTSLIEKFEKYFSQINVWESNTVADLSINSPEWDVNVDLKSDFDFDKTKESFAWDIKWNVKVVSEDINWSWTLDVSMLMDKKTLYTKLNDFNLSMPWEDWDKSVALVKAMFLGYIWKWISLDLSNDDYLRTHNTSSLFMSNKDFLNVYKKYPLLKLVKENEDPNFYNYDVELNNESIVSIMKELSDLNGKKINEKDVENLKEEVNKIKFSWNIKIDVKKKEYFVFSWSVDEMNFGVDNNKSNFIVNMSWNWWELKMDLKKSLKWWTLTMFVLNNWKEELNATFDINLSAKNIDIVWNIDFEDAKIKLDVKSKINEKKSIEISVPKESISIEDIIKKGFSWWMYWAESMDTINESWSLDINDLWESTSSWVIWEEYDKQIQSTFDELNIDGLEKDVENTEKIINSDGMDKNN